MNLNKILKAFLSQSDDGFVVIDADCSISEVNNAIIELSGFSVDELKGEALKNLFECVTAEKICNIYENFGSKESQHKIFGELIQKDGSTQKVDININCSGDTDEPCWLLIKNSSFENEMEKKLKHSELLLHTILESLPFDFWINDADNKTYLQNSHSKALWGDVKGRTPGEVTDNEKINDQWLDATARALDGEVINGEISYIINGRRKYFRNILAPIKDDEHLFGIFGMNIDISDLKEAVEMRDMLLKEVHHRVKNNLQMIIGIIRLEEVESCEGTEDCSVLEDIIHRIEAVSMIHERLYQADINNIIHASDYIRSLVEQIVSGYRVEDLELILDLEEPDVETDKIILLGLIINELVTNSLKYAYNAAGSHLLKLKLNKKNEVIEVLLSDSGPGLPDDFGNKDSKSLGMLMVKTFVKQLGGVLSWESSVDGTTFSFSFPIKKAEAV